MYFYSFLRLINSNVIYVLNFFSFIKSFNPEFTKAKTASSSHCEKIPHLLIANLKKIMIM